MSSRPTTNTVVSIVSIETVGTSRTVSTIGPAWAAATVHTVVVRPFEGHFYTSRSLCFTAICFAAVGCRVVPLTECAVRLVTINLLLKVMGHR